MVSGLHVHQLLAFCPLLSLPLQNCYFAISIAIAVDIDIAYAIAIVMAQQSIQIHTHTDTVIFYHHQCIMPKNIYIGIGATILSSDFRRVLFTLRGNL